MATKKKVGRPKKTNKVKLVPLYLNDEDKARVFRKYGNATIAVKKVILPKCG
jgi:hypothetical protein